MRGQICEVFISKGLLYFYHIVINIEKILVYSVIGTKSLIQHFIKFLDTGRLFGLVSLPASCPKHQGSTVLLLPEDERRGLYMHYL